VRLDHRARCRVRRSATIVAKVLKKLARAGLVTSERGSRGGYRLARPPADVSLRAIVTALEGPISLTFCSSGTASGRCRTRPLCVASDAMQRLNHLVNGAFDAVSLEDILRAPDAPGTGLDGRRGVTRRRPVYLDHQATTPLDPRVLEAMLPWLTGEFGNAASRQHAWGWTAGSAVEAAREEVAAALGAEPGRSSSPRGRPSRTTSRSWGPHGRRAGGETTS
jgi:Rrf2 family protein